MNSMGQPGSANGSGQSLPPKTINLQGVASFAGLVELLSQELGTTGSTMQGQLPSGPDSFDKLMAELELVTQGFQRKLILVSQPGHPLTLRFQCNWSRNPDMEATDAEVVAGITADYYLGATVEEILPQGRALARYIEDVFGVLDRMVTLGHSQKLAGMAVPASKMQAFENESRSATISDYDPDVPMLEVDE
jgi:hypothetical protein